MSNNYFYGTLPGFIENLSNLTALALSGNYFFGAIPDNISALKQLENLKLSNNYMNGTVTAAVSFLDKLQSLDLSYNLFCEVSESLIQLTNLRKLDLGFNKFTGAIPQFIGNMQNLTKLYLGGNQFSGSIPLNFQNLHNVQLLDLRSNVLSGSLWPLNELTNIFYLFLEENFFVQAVPVSLMQGMKLCNLSYNCFTQNLSQWCNSSQLRSDGCDCLNEGKCFIGNTCWSSMEQDNENPCNICRPAFNATDWTFYREAYCLIDNVCVAEGTPNPTQYYKDCNPQANTFGWTDTYADNQFRLDEVHFSDFVVHNPLPT